MNLFDLKKNCYWLDATNQNTETRLNQFSLKCFVQKSPDIFTLSFSILLKILAGILEFYEIIAKFQKTEFYKTFFECHHFQDNFSHKMKYDLKGH